MSEVLPSMEELLERAEEKGRTDTIDEVIHVIDEYGIYFENDEIERDFYYLMERIRRQENEQREVSKPNRANGL